MDFATASSIARSVPGSTLTRNEKGEFVVIGSDGTLVGSTLGGVQASSECSQCGNLREELEREKKRSRVLSERLTHAEEQLKAQEEDLTGEWEASEERADSERKRADELANLLAEFKQKISVLEERTSKVSAAEWARIEAERFDLLRKETARERDLALSAATSPSVSLKSLQLILYQSGSLHLIPSEYAIVEAAFREKVAHVRPPQSGENTFAVFASNDGQ